MTLMVRKTVLYWPLFYLFLLPAAFLGGDVDALGRVLMRFGFKWRIGSGRWRPLGETA